MPTIPSGQKFHTIASNVATKERGSSLVNAQKNIYTMQDIIDTVPAGAAVNPTSTYLPYNNGGVFADSPLNYSSSVVKTIFNNLSGNVQGGIQITGNAAVPNNNFTTIIGDYLGTTGQTVLTVYSNGGIIGYTGNGPIELKANGAVTLQDITQANRATLGGSELGWVGAFGGPKGGSSFSLPIYLTGLGMTVHIPLYM
jgi:hypothetical protein